MSGRWAEKEYPDKPSLWLPDAPAPVKEDDPTLKLAKNYAQTFAEGRSQSRQLGLSQSDLILTHRMFCANSRQDSLPGCLPSSFPLSALTL